MPPFSGHLRAAAAVLCCGLAIASLSGCAAQSGTPPALTGVLVPAGTKLGDGAIVGRVFSKGPVSEGEPVVMNADAWCRGSHAEPPRNMDFVVAADGALKNAFVRIATGIDQRFAPPAEPVTLDQRGCFYQPRVVGMQVGQPLRVLNSDATLHNVHTTSRANAAFNFGMTLQGQEVTRYFDAEEVMIPVRCNVHPWMTGFIGVLWHPYFDVTDETGEFAIRDVPPGRYEIEVWHERLGTLRRAVTLGPDETADLTLAYP